MSVAKHKLQVTDLSLSFNGVAAISDVTMHVDSGFTGLIGPNGAGKTTLLNAISGFVKASAGSIDLEGRPITNMRPDAVARAGVGRTFQTPRLVNHLSLRDNVLLGLDGRRSLLRQAGDLLRAKAYEAEAREEADAFIAALGLHPRVRADSLPLPSRKVVEIARAVISRPSLLLLDEPAAGLSSSDVARVIGPLTELVATMNIAVLIIEHDIAFISQLCQRLVALHLGRIVADGTPLEVANNRTVVEAYLGGRHVPVDD